MSINDEDPEHDMKQIPVMDSDADDDEVTQDWSEAAKLSKKNAQTSLPKRGEKDYEPDGTNLQELLLYRAQKSMFDTLYSAVRGTILNNQVKAYYVPAFEEAVIPNPKGGFSQTMGKFDTHGKCWLKLHEFVYLSERGTITPYYCKSFPVIAGKDNEDFEVPLSMQDLYSFFKSQEEMDSYFVYAHLKRLGFIVSLTDDPPIDNTTFYPPGTPSTFNETLQRIYSKFFKFWNYHKNQSFNFFFYGSWNFLLKRYTSTSQIYRGMIRLIPFVRPPKTINDLYKQRSLVRAGIQSSSLKIFFNVWKPQTNFKKRSPGLPDFQVLIHNKNAPDSHFPTYSELKNVFRSLDCKFGFLTEIKDDISWNKHSYTNGQLRTDYLASLKSKAVQIKSSIHNKMARSRKKPGNRKVSPTAEQMKCLKSGYRSFLIAIVDDGLISFVKISEADFGSEYVWYEPPQVKGNSTAAKKRID